MIQVGSWTPTWDFVLGVGYTLVGLGIAAVIKTYMEFRLRLLHEAKWYKVLDVEERAKRRRKELKKLAKKLVKRDRKATRRYLR